MLNIKKRLSIWERRYVSVGGRLTLVKSTLSSLPALSSEQCQKQLKRCKGSFYGEIPYHTEEKLHMVKWENMAKGWKFGGLGFKRLVQHNSAMLAKWWWRYSTERDALLVKVSFKENTISGTTTGYHNYHNFQCLDDNNSVFGELIQEGFKIKVNYGKLTRFSRLYVLSTQKEAKVSDIAEENGVGGWNLIFTRNLIVWERDQYQGLS